MMTIPDTEEQDPEELPEGVTYMGLDDTGLPYWNVRNVGFVGEGW